MSFTKEKDFEDALVNMLHMEAGWKDPILTYPTEKTFWTTGLEFSSAITVVLTV